MKKLLAAFLATSFAVFGQSPVLRNAFSTNASPVAAATVRGGISGTTGTGSAVFANLPSLSAPILDSPTILNAVDFGAGNFRIIMPTGATVAGMNVGSVAVDPSTPANGDIWYNSAAVQLRARIGAATVNIGGGGSVTSVGSSFPAELTLTSSSPITTAGTITYIWTVQAANRVFAGPTTGVSATPGFRALVNADIPGTLTLTEIDAITAKFNTATVTNGLTAATVGATTSVSSPSGLFNTVAATNSIATPTATVNNLSVTNNENVGGTSSVGALNVTNVASVVTSREGSLAVTNNATVGGTLGVGGALTASSLGVTNTASLATLNVGTSTFTNTPTLPAQTSNTFWAGPTSGAAAVPTFRAIVASDIPQTLQNSTVTNLNVTGVPTISNGASLIGSIFVETNSAGAGTWSSSSGSAPNNWFLRNFAWKEFGYSAGTSGAGVNWGTQSGSLGGGSSLNNAPGALMASIDSTTSGSSNSTSGYFTENSFSSAASLQIGWLVAWTNINTMRAWCGITRAGNQAAMVQANTPGIDAAGFNYTQNTTLTNTTWQYFTCDNSTTSSSDSGVTVTTSPTMFWIIGNDGGTSFDFYINGTFIGTKTSNLPRTSQAYAAQACAAAQDANVKTVRIYLVRGRTRISL